MLTSLPTTLSFSDNACFGLSLRENVPPLPYDDVVISLQRLYLEILLCRPQEPKSRSNKRCA